METAFRLVGYTMIIVGTICMCAGTLMLLLRNCKNKRTTTSKNRELTVEAIQKLVEGEIRTAINECFKQQEKMFDSRLMCRIMHSFNKVVFQRLGCSSTTVTLFGRQAMSVQTTFINGHVCRLNGPPAGMDDLSIQHYAAGLVGYGIHLTEAKGNNAVLQHEGKVIC